MTAMADITVKKYDGTTDIVWSQVTASGGDKTPALWRSSSAVGVLGQKPTFTMTGKWNAASTVRRLDVTAVFPSVYTDTTTSLTQTRSKAVFTGSFAFPQDMSVTDINEAAAQIPNLIASTLIKNSFAWGFAPV